MVIIPACNPPEQSLLKLVDELIKLNVDRLIIVNDGSGADKNDLFKKLTAFDACVVFRHSVNLGKRRALKTAFNYVLNTYSDVHAEITADADGQHTPADIMRVTAAILQSNRSFVIGVRQFKKEVPFRSKFGNILTQAFFQNAHWCKDL